MQNNLLLGASNINGILFSKDSHLQSKKGDKDQESINQVTITAHPKKGGMSLKISKCPVKSNFRGTMSPKCKIRGETLVEEGSDQH